MAMVAPLPKPFATAGATVCCFPTVTFEASTASTALPSFCLGHPAVELHPEYGGQEGEPGSRLDGFRGQNMPRVERRRKESKKPQEGGGITPEFEE